MWGVTLTPLGALALSAMGVFRADDHFILDAHSHEHQHGDNDTKHRWNIPGLDGDDHSFKFLQWRTPPHGSQLVQIDADWMRQVMRVQHALQDGAGTRQTDALELSAQEINRLAVERIERVAVHDGALSHERLLSGNAWLMGHESCR